MGSHQKRGRPGGIEELRAQLRAQFDKGWAKTRLEQVEREKDMTLRDALAGQGTPTRDITTAEANAGQRAREDRLNALGRAATQHPTDPPSSLEQSQVPDPGPKG